MDSHSDAVATPPLPVTNNPYILLGIPLNSDFDAVRLSELLIVVYLKLVSSSYTRQARKAYLHLCKLYHPDVRLGPYCTDQEKKDANWDFSRINSAYDILKRKHDEEEHEYSTYVDGELVTKKVRVAKVDTARNRKNNPERKVWYQQDSGYQSRHNGFEPASSFDTYKRGSWWRNEDRESEGEIWSSQRHLEHNARVAQGGFGFNPKQNHHWWEDDRHSSYGVSQETQHGYQKPRQSMRFKDPKSNAGYPYKDRMWNSEFDYEG